MGARAFATAVLRDYWTPISLAAILLAIAPIFFSVVMQLLGLLTGLIQAYIFAILAMVYIASASASHEGQAGG